jgi:hypothetical protein
MANKVSSAPFDQHSQNSIDIQTFDPAKLSLQDAQQLIHELQARQQVLEKQNAALHGAQLQLENRHYGRNAWR